jgi:hypothetical protein
MRVLDIDPDKILISRQPGNHRQLLTLETRGGELLAVELTDAEVTELVGRLTAAEAGEALSS